MNPNELMAQQQAMLNQALQNVQRIQFGAVVLSLALMLLGALVTYMFYARLRGIEDEIRKFRIAYEFSHTPEMRTKARREARSESALPEPQKPITEMATAQPTLSSAGSSISAFPISPTPNWSHTA
jgi:hypothetical protein